MVGQSRAGQRRQSGFTTAELGVVLVVILVMTAVSLPVALNTIRTYRRDAAARHVLWQIRSTQSLATSRNAVIGFQWGPSAGRPADNYRIVRDSTGSCVLPAASAPKDGTTVFENWVDLGETYPGLTIRSIRDAASAPLNGVMFNAIGASVNTCATASFPVTVIVADGSGRARTLVITNAGSTQLR